MIKYVLCAAAIAIGVMPAAAQSSADHSWPDKPIHLIVPFPAGSATDIVARIVGQKLGERLGQLLIIDNRPGASGAVGSEVVAHAAADGYTLGLASSSTHSLAVSVSANLPYDPLKDFTYVSMIGEAPYVLAIFPGLKMHSVADLIATAKAKPGALNYGTAGTASLANLAGALFSSMAGVKLAEVPYRSSSQAVIDVAEGRIEMQFGTLAPTLPFIRNGKLRAIATTGAKRSALLADVPTISESGLPGYEASLWMAIVMPPGVPLARRDRLNAEINAALASPTVVQQLNAQGMIAEPSTPDALRSRVGEDIAKWRRVTQEAGIKPQ
jgi:tripartite-type tricarboxylate transporter receptor subunit TctC